MVQGCGDGGRQRVHIRNVHSLMSLLPLCYSTHKSSFCEEEREYSDGHPSHFLLQLVGKTDACQRILIKNTPDVVRRPACFVVKGVVRVQGSGFRVVEAASPRSRAQVVAVLAFVISHTTFLAAQDDETGRCPKVC